MLYNIGDSIGQIIGPLMGGYMVQWWGFENTSAYIGYVNLAYAVIYGCCLLIPVGNKNK